MPRKPALHSVDQLLGPSVERTVEAIDPPDSDAGLVALARILAAAVDKMSDAERAAMLGQTVPSVLRVLVELEKRAAARRGAAAGKAVNPIQQMRRAHAAARAR